MNQAYSCAIAMLALMACGGASAQTVRQGATQADAIPNTFHSPMVIETVFAAADRSTWGKKGWLEPDEYHALGRYSCDGVSLRSFTDGEKWATGFGIQARERRAGTLEIRFRVWSWNPRHNHDKLVELFLEVMNGVTVIGSGVLGPVPTSDNERGHIGAFIINVPAESVHTDPPTTLRITLTTKDY